MNRMRIMLAVMLLALIASFYAFDLDQYLTLEYFSQQQDVVEAFVANNRLLAISIFFVIYITATGLSLPVAAIFALIAGALFKMWLGALVISFASVTGATLAFLASRFLLQEYVDRKFPKATAAINEGLSRDGPYYLFCVRLMPAMPYFVLNLVMGVTHMPVRTFAWVTQLGLLPITLVLTNAGEQIAQVKSPADIMSPGLIGSLTLIGLFPLIAKKLVEQIQAKRTN